MTGPWAGRRLRRRPALPPPGPLRDVLTAPVPGPSTPHTDLRLLAVDLETTGLDPATDRILSIGLVPVDGDRVVLAGARRLVVRGAQDVGSSATVHGLTDDQVAQGVPLEEALTVVLTALRGRLLLGHHVVIERTFLSAACEAVLGAPLTCPCVDTMVLAHRLLDLRWGQDPPPGSLRLDAARRRHGLPRYRSHEALTDALACAELYLAQVAALGHGRPVTLRGLVREA